MEGLLREVVDGLLRGEVSEINFYVKKYYSQAIFGKMASGTGGMDLLVPDVPTYSGSTKNQLAHSTTATPAARAR